MAYTAPVVTASAQTHAQLLSRGLKGHVDGLITANAASSAPLPVQTLTRQLMTPSQAEIPLKRLDQVLQTWQSGTPVAATEVTAQLKEFQAAYLLVATAVGEMAVLIDANPGTITPSAQVTANFHGPRRTWP
jgi:hypothetical protein